MGLTALAQTQFRSISLEEALNIAKQERKHVFVDFYTVWCGPCKKMSLEVFNQVEVGKYFNQEFVNLKVDAEKIEGKELAKKYRIGVFPTFVILNADGEEIYRTSGARPAGEFVDKIRKGIDPQWSPNALVERYKKGERTPELVNEFVLLQMECGNGENGLQIIQDYFDNLSDRERVKPENFFLYKRYTLNYKDPKADYMFANKDCFVKENGEEEVERLLYNWLRQEIMPWVSVKEVVHTEENLRELKRFERKLQQAKLAHPDGLSALYEMANVRWDGNLKVYLNICREKFSSFEPEDRFTILLDLGRLEDADDGIKQLAADLIREHLDEVEGFNRRVLYQIMLKFEGMNEYRLRASIDEVRKGKVLVSYFQKGKLKSQEYEFDDHLIDINIVGKDTVVATMYLLCEELRTSLSEMDSCYPQFNFIIVPGEFVVIKLFVKKGPDVSIEYQKGGGISEEYIRSNNDLVNFSKACNIFLQLTFSQSYAFFEKKDRNVWW
ncbi:MAG: hypothetical protein BHV81_14830 [Butyricimonas synergistica]|nr:MAG: hypothetical protein BHV81_14830 [Butyricimonas synergistica]